MNRRETALKIQATMCAARVNAYGWRNGGGALPLLFHSFTHRRMLWFWFTPIFRPMYLCQRCSQLTHALDEPIWCYSLLSRRFGILLHYFGKRGVQSFTPLLWVVWTDSSWYFGQLLDIGMHENEMNENENIFMDLAVLKGNSEFLYGSKAYLGKICLDFGWILV